MTEMGFMDQLKEQFSFSELTGLYQSYKSGELDVAAILNDEFMQKYTDFDNVAAFMTKLGIQDKNQLIDFMKDRTNRQHADQVVKEHSQFDSLIEMAKKALEK
jgi:ferritin